MCHFHRWSLEDVLNSVGLGTERVRREGISWTLKAAQQQNRPKTSVNIPGL